MTISVDSRKGVVHQSIVQNEQDIQTLGVILAGFLQTAHQNGSVLKVQAGQKKTEIESPSALSMYITDMKHTLKPVFERVGCILFTIYFE